MSDTANRRCRLHSQTLTFFSLPSKDLPFEHCVVKDDKSLSAWQLCTAAASAQAHFQCNQTTTTTTTPPTTVVLLLTNRTYQTHKCLCVAQGQQSPSLPNSKTPTAQQHRNETTTTKHHHLSS